MTGFLEAITDGSADPITVEAGLLAGPRSGLLVFGWATVLDENDVMQVWDRGSHAGASRWQVMVNDAAYHGASVLDAEVQAWTYWHFYADTTLTSLSGAKISRCPECGGAASLGTWASTTGFFVCRDGGCAWSELGALTDCFTHVLTLPWPHDVEILDETFENTRGGVTLGVYTSNQHGFQITRPTFAEAELAAFEKFMREYS